MLVANSCLKIQIMETTIVIDLQKVAGYSKYFEHFLRPNGKYLKDTPSCIDVSFIYRLSCSEEDALQFGTLFISLLNACPISDSSVKSIEFINTMMEVIPLNFIIDLTMYFQVDIINNQLLNLIESNHKESVTILKRIHFNNCDPYLLQRFYHAFSANVPLPKYLKDKPLALLINESGQKLKTAIRDETRRRLYASKLVSEICPVCKIKETFPFYKFGNYLRKTRCCLTAMHAYCYEDMIRHLRQWTVCEKRTHARLCDSSQVIGRRCSIIRKNLRRDDMLYPKFELSDFLIG